MPSAPVSDGNMPAQSRHRTSQAYRLKAESRPRSGPNDGFAPAHSRQMTQLASHGCDNLTQDGRANTVGIATYLNDIARQVCLLLPR